MLWGPVESIKTPAVLRRALTEVSTPKPQASHTLQSLSMPYTMFFSSDSGELDWIHVLLHVGMNCIVNMVCRWIHTLCRSTSPSHVHGSRVNSTYSYLFEGARNRPNNAGDLESQTLPNIPESNDSDESPAEGTSNTQD
jgi:hypothetical protein